MANKETKKKGSFRHKDYLLSLADKISMTSPSTEIIYNTLLDVFKTGATEGYLLRLTQSRKFKDKREEHRKRSFDMIRDNFDNIIHSKSNQSDK